MKSDTINKYRRRVTLAAAVVVLVALAYFFLNYGSWTVLDGMDTMPDDYPPGATCIIQKSPRSVPKGSVVLLAVRNGAVLLTRVERVEDDRIFIRHDNRVSVFLHFEKQSYPLSDVQGLVLSALLPDPDGGDDPRGK